MPLSYRLNTAWPCTTPLPWTRTADEFVQLSACGLGSPGTAPACTSLWSGDNRRSVIAEPLQQYNLLFLLLTVSFHCRKDDESSPDNKLTVAITSPRCSLRNTPVDAAQSPINANPPTRKPMLTSSPNT